MILFIDCEKCQEDKECGKKPEVHRNILSCYVKGEPAGCPDYTPYTYRGLDGVAA